LPEQSRILYKKLGQVTGRFFIYEGDGVEEAFLRFLHGPFGHSATALVARFHLLTQRRMDIRDVKVCPNCQDIGRRTGLVEASPLVAIVALRPLPDGNGQDVLLLLVRVRTSRMIKDPVGWMDWRAAESRLKNGDW
jgi:hypothetical protein